MASFEIYQGGPSTSNFSRAQFPSAPFVASAAAFQAAKVAAHKGPTGYGLTRVLDTTDTAFAEFLRNNTIAQGDVLGSILIPKNVIYKGMYFEVENAQGTATTTITPSLRSVAGGTFPAIAANTVGKGYGRVGATAWQSTSASLGDAADGTEFFIAEPTILDLTLTVLPASKLGALRLILTPMVENLYHGQY